MPKSFDEVLDDIFELSPEDIEKVRAVLIGAPPTLHPAWGPELRRRAAEIDSGEVRMIPWDDVCAEIDEILNEAEQSDA